MKNLSFESMTNLHILDYHVRVWRTEESIGKQTRDDIMEVAEMLRQTKGTNKTTILKALSDLPDVAAVEVLDYFGHGAIAYVNWPE